MNAQKPRIGFFKAKALRRLWRRCLKVYEWRPLNEGAPLGSLFRLESFYTLRVPLRVEGWARRFVLGTPPPGQSSSQELVRGLGFTIPYSL